MKILYVSDFYPPFVGGAERQVQQLAQLMHGRGHSVMVATVAQSATRASASASGLVRHVRCATTALPWMSADRSQRQHPPLPDPLTTLELRDLLRTWRPDVVHSQGWISYSMAAALAFSRIPFIVSARDYGYGCPTRSLWRNSTAVCEGPGFMKCLSSARQRYGPVKGAIAVAGVTAGKKLLNRKVTTFHAISRYVAETLERDVVSGRVPVRVIPSILTADVAGARVDLPEPLPERPFILFVGALTPHKGLDTLLAAYAQLSSPPPLVLIGTKWHDSPKRFPHEVSVLTDVPHSTVMAAWTRSLFGVAPSRWPEPLGNSVLEAMSQGRPVIGTIPGGHRDVIVDGQNGLLVPGGDTEALRNAMQRLIADIGLTRRMGEAARETAAEFSSDRLIGRYEAMYVEAIGS